MPKESIKNNDSGLKFLLRAFKYRNYRLFFSGQIISVTGTWMQMIAVVWLVYRLTNSAFLLGLVGFIGQAPTFIFSPLAGVLADHFERRKILIATQTLAMLQAFILSILAFSGSIAVWHIIALSVFLGIINAFDAPVRQAFVIDMVEKKEDLGNAIALNSSMFNAARLLGPSLAGIIIASFGEGICFLLNGISFLGVIFVLFLMKTKQEKSEFETRHMLRSIKEGLLYVFGYIAIRHILILISVFSLVGMSYVVVMPVVVREILMGTVRTLGFLMGAAGLGALSATIYLAYQKDIFGLEKLIPASTIFFGLSLIILSLSRIFWLSLILMLFIGFGMMVQMAASNTIIQNIAEDRLRGRVMSFFTMAFMGVAPFGTLMAGALADKIGASGALIINGVLCSVAAMIFLSRIGLITKAIEAAVKKSV
ncbi:MAG: MFS transporter [Candidatus Omnitrophica bacterium]|nr:MFS transporter [Candidatus Omnitrophota bacterium]